MTEEQEHKQISEYIKYQYPNVIFNTDMSGMKLTIGQGKKAAGLRSKDKFPDIIIYHVNNDYAGLFIELKKTGTKLYKKDLTFKSEHLEQQHETLQRLQARGYKAVFAIGFDQAKTIIDNYMKI